MKWPLSVLALLLAPAAFAEPPKAQADLFELSLEQLLEIEVYTPQAVASRVEQSASHVHVITREVIQRRGYRSLLDALEEVPEVQVRRRSHQELREVVSFRGISDNNKLIILIDGVRMSSAAGTPHSVGPSFSLANAERIEVLIGPASALYGADAFSGVVNIITRSGGDVRGVEVTVAGGQLRTLDTTLVAGTEVGDIDLALTASYVTSEEPNLADVWEDDYAWFHDQYTKQGKALGFGKRDDPSTWTDVTPEAFAMPTRAWMVDARARWGDLEVGYTRHADSHSSSTAIPPEDSLYTEAAKYAWTIETAFVRNRSKLFDDRLTLYTLANVNTYELDPDTRFINKFVGFEGGYKYEQSLVTRIEQRAGWTFGPWLTATLGLVWQDFSGQPKSADLPRAYDPDVTADSQGLTYMGTDVLQNFYHYRYQNYGGWLELRSDPAPWLSLNTAVRADENTRYGTSVSPRAGVSFAPAEGTSLKLLYGEAFLAPSPYHAYAHFGSFNADPDTGQLRSSFFRAPNEDLKPERLRTGEIVASQRLGEMLYLSANGYVTHVRDLQKSGGEPNGEFLNIPVDFLSRRENGGSALLYGGTLRADLRWTPGQVHVQPWLAYTLSDGEVDDEPLPHHSTHVIKSGLDLGWRGLSLSTQIQYRSSALEASHKDDDGNPKAVDGWLRLNAHLRYQHTFSEDGIQAALWVRGTNLLDSRYRIATDASGAFFGAPQDPLQVLGGLELKL